MRYSVVLVPFPFDDLTSTKVWPAVCLTEAVGPHRHVVLAFITSQVASQPLPSDLVVAEEDPDFTATGLRVSSMIQLHRLLTTTTSVLMRALGRLTPRLQKAAGDRLRALFSLR